MTIVDETIIIDMITDDYWLYETIINNIMLITSNINNIKIQPAQHDLLPFPHGQQKQRYVGS